MKLTNRRFATEATRLQDYPLVDTDFVFGPTASEQPPARIVPGAGPLPAQPPRAPGEGNYDRKTTAQTGKKTDPPAKPITRDPRPGVISHSHQKLHRTLLDADLRAGPVSDVKRREPFSGASVAPAGSVGTRDGRLRRALAVLTLILTAVVAYGYLMIRQNNLSAQQLPGVRGAINFLEGPGMAKLRRGAAAFEAAGDRTAESVAQASARLEHWLKTR